MWAKIGPTRGTRRQVEASSSHGISVTRFSSAVSSETTVRSGGAPFALATFDSARGASGARV